MTVRYSAEDHVARVTIDRADRMNAVDEPTADSLEEVWRQIESDSSIRAVVLTGSGDKAAPTQVEKKNVVVAILTLLLSIPALLGT